MKLNTHLSDPNSPPGKVFKMGTKEVQRNTLFSVPNFGLKRLNPPFLGGGSPAPYLPLSTFPIRGLVDVLCFSCDSGLESACLVSVLNGA